MSTTTETKPSPIYQGAPCPACGDTQKYRVNANCVTCAKARSQARRDIARGIVPAPARVAPPALPVGQNRKPETVYQGAPCKTCGSTERYKRDRTCAPCHRTAARKREGFHKPCATVTRGVPAPRQGQPFPYPVLTARLIATAPGSSAGGRSQKFLVSGESWDTAACPCLWLWDEACAPGLKVGAAGFLVREIRSAILPGVANWYFVPEVTP